MRLITPTLHQQIHASYARLKSRSKVATELGINRHTAAKWILIPLQATTESQQPNRRKEGTSTLRELLLGERLSVAELVEKLDVAPSTVRELLVTEPGVERDGDKFWIEKAVEVEPLREAVQADRSERRAKLDYDGLKRRYDHLLEEHDASEARFAALLKVKERVEPLRVTFDPTLSKDQSVAIVTASDWHVGERVDPKTINGLNEYNPDIAQSRARFFFQNTLKLVRKERQNAEIDTLVLWLGGDFLSGYIHPELEESNYMSPTEEVRFAKSLLIGGLKMLKEDGEFKRILVPTSHGNHGRTVMKRRVSTSAANSYEWMMYSDLADLFSGDEVIEFQVASGYFNYLKIYNKALRFSHGDNIRSLGGISGLLHPAVKYFSRANAQTYADFDTIGHFHQRIPYSAVYRIAVNGSLIGFNAFAQSISASPEPPTQNFQLLNHKRGFTIATQIDLED